MRYFRGVLVGTESPQRIRIRREGVDLSFNDLGIFFMRGMGCHRHTNCFTCTEDDCKFKDNDPDDARYKYNRGDGIKVW